MLKRWTTMAVLALSAVLPVYATEPEPRADKPPAGMGLYLMVLRDPALDARPGQPPPPPRTEPDIPKLGGRVLRSHQDERVVFLPLGVSKRLRRDPNVLFLQRVWTGEPLETWDEIDDPNSVRSEGTLSPRAESTAVVFDTGTYAYDGSGNVKAIGNESYAYDSAGRLIRSASRGGTETYKYDTFGNLTERARAGSAAVTTAVDPRTNRLTARTYDAVGNMTRDGMGREYRYDASGMLVTLYTSGGADERRMIYTPDDERIGVFSGGGYGRVVVRDFAGRVLRGTSTRGTKKIRKCRRR